MKKLLAVLLILCMVVSLSACGKKSAEKIGGEYQSLAFIPFNFMDYFDVGGQDVVLELDEDESNINYSFSKSGQQTSSGIASFEDEYLLLGEVKCLYKDKCIVRYDDAMREKIKRVEGTLPSDNQRSDFSIEIDNPLYDAYYIEFFKDGSCEIELQNLVYAIFYEGRYKVENHIIFMEINNGSIKAESEFGYSNEKSGLLKTAIYVTGDYVYTCIYQKIKDNE